MWALYDLLVIALETWLLFQFADMWQNPAGKTNERSGKVRIISYVAAVLIVYLVILLNRTYISRIGGLFTCFAADTILLSLIYKRPLFKSCFLTALFYTVNLLSEIWVISALSLFTNYDAAVPESQDSLQMLAALFSKLLVLLAIRFSKQKLPAHFFTDNLHSRRNLLLQTSTCFCVLAISAFIIPIDQDPTTIRILLMVQLVAAGLAFVVIFLLGSRYRQEERKQAKVKAQGALDYGRWLTDYKMQLESYEKELRHQSHDLKHHLQYIATVLQRPGSKNHVLDYLRKVTRNIPQKPLVSHMTGNQIVDAILFAKENAALQIDVAMQVSGKLSANLRIDPIDLTSLLSNLLDNAIEACEKIPLGDAVSNSPSVSGTDSSSDVSGAVGKDIDISVSGESVSDDKGIAGSDSGGSDADNKGIDSSGSGGSDADDKGIAGSCPSGSDADGSGSSNEHPREIRVHFQDTRGGVYIEVSNTILPEQITKAAVRATSARQKSAGRATSARQKSAGRATSVRQSGRTKKRYDRIAKLPGETGKTPIETAEELTEARLKQIFKSSKKDPGEHGQGLSIINSIVKKYDGYRRIILRNNRITSQIYLNKEPLDFSDS